MNSIILFFCIGLIALGGCGVVVSVADLYQDWWDMDITERCATIIGILCFIGCMVAGFCPWY